MSNVKTNSLKAWWLASRPKTLAGAAAPVLAGGAFAYSVMKCMLGGLDAFRSWSCDVAISSLSSILAPFGLCLLFALLMQVDANFVNDYFDFKKGTDREDRLGPERACAQGWITPKAMRVGIAVATVLSCLVGIGILLLTWRYELIIVGVLCVLGCFLYTTKLSYMGWGDVLVLVFFGVVPVLFTAYVSTGGAYYDVPVLLVGGAYYYVPVVLAGIAMGLATDTLLVVNNYRDRNQDAVSGKLTIIVRIIDRQIRKLGELQGRKEGEQICQDLYMWLGVFATLLAIVALFFFPLSSIKYPFMLVYLMLHFRALKKFQSLDGKALNEVLGTTARNIFLFGLLLAVSVVVGL